MDKSGTTSGQLDIWSTFCVRLTFSQMYPPVEASQVSLNIWSTFGSGLTFDQPLRQADL